MGGRATIVAAIASILFAGCALDRVGIAAVASDRRDGGRRDAGREDAGTEPRDAQMQGDGGTCEARCEGATAVRCEGGAEIFEACDRCVLGAEGPSCAARVCEPGRARCAGDVLFTCDALGERESPTACEHGCSESACRPAPSCPWDAEIGQIVDEGTYAVNLCGRGDDHGVLDGSCEGASAGGEDTLVRLVLTERARLRLDLRDTDGPAAVDTVLSIRRACDVESTQMACADDVPCDDADDDLRNTTCESGRQPRQSRLVTQLEAGTYYLVLDTNVRSSFTCGQVELRVRRMPGASE